MTEFVLHFVLIFITATPQPESELNQLMNSIYKSIQKREIQTAQQSIDIVRPNGDLHP